MIPPYPEVLVCWSGGCDSTLLLYHAARAYGTPRSPVRAISITSDQVTSGKYELRARARIAKAFKKMGLHITYSEMSLTTSFGDQLNWFGLPQAVIWLLASQALLENETLALGYMRGDDWTSHVEAFRSVFDTLQRIADRKGILWLPFLMTEKRGVLHQLTELDLLKLTWWCEVPATARPKTGPCGTCSSCQTHATALWKLEHHGTGSMWEGNVV